VSLHAHGFNGRFLAEEVTGAGSPVRTECSGLRQTSLCEGWPTIRIISRTDPGTSDRNAWPIEVSANRPSRRCLRTRLLATARIRRNVAHASDSTRWAISSADRGPEASLSAMLS
jgi:hypothetical protein